MRSPPRTGSPLSTRSPSGQGDQSVLRQLSDQAIADGVDAIIPHCHPGRPGGRRLRRGDQDPGGLRAISDPAAADLTGIDYVTGTSDALDTSKIMDMIFSQGPRGLQDRPALLPVRGQLHHPPSPTPRPTWMRRGSATWRPPPTPTTRSSPPPAPSSPPGWTPSSPPPTTSSCPPSWPSMRI